MKKINGLPVQIGIFLFILTVVTLFGYVRAQPGTQQNMALERAIEYARNRGLRNHPADLVIKQTTLSEWFAIIGFEPGDDAAKVGLDPAKAIWIVAMKGNVEWSGPGRQIGGSGNEFDNISIALDVNTLEYIGAFAAGPDERLPLGLQR